MIRWLLIQIVLLACVQSAHATQPFRTKRLAAMAGAVGFVAPSKNDVDTVFTYRGRQMRARTDGYGELVHLGYVMFPPIEGLDVNTRALYEFIERYALELDLRLDGRSPAERLELDKVFCGKGNISMLAQVTPETAFTVDEIERRMYRVSWALGGKALSLTIPADYQLIAGADALELEENIERDLKRVLPIAGDALLYDYSGANVTKADGFLIANSGEYLSNLIRSDIYLKEERGRRSIIIDKRKPIQSATNILLTGMSDNEIPLHLTLDKYGYKNSEMDITLQQFIGLCRNEGCKLYAGVKRKTKDMVSATIFAFNSKMAYNHVLSIELPLAVIHGEKADAKGVLYAYIPLQNVTEKFFTQDLKDYKR